MTELGDQVELVAVVDVDLPRPRRWPPSAGAGLRLPRRRLANEEIDVVSVCTPTGLHGTVAIEALKAGKNVIIEKPAEVTVEKTDEIIAAQREAGTLVSVISQHRFDPATDIAVAAIDAGELGRLTSGDRVDRLVARTELLRLRRLARHLGARRRRRDDEPGRPHRRPAHRHGWAGPSRCSPTPARSLMSASRPRTSRSPS